MIEANQRIRVAVDAMGGDFAPTEIIKGAVMAAENQDTDIFLIGVPEIVEPELARYDIAQLPITFIPAEDRIEETENPALAVRRKPKASISIAARMVKNGEADGMISAGPTGAIATSAIAYLGMIEGIERPVIGGVIFDDVPDTVVFDCGVNMDCRPYHLLTFAAIGSVYCKKLLDIPNPTVGLLNIGSEETKGNQLTRTTHKLFKESVPNFIGNIEGFQVMSRKANVIVCDAFVGNVLFKFVESIGLFNDRPSSPGQNKGGGLILGVNGIVRKMHGFSKAPHVAETICQVQEAVKADLVGAIEAEIKATVKLAEVS